MKTLIMLVALLGISLLHAQTTILNETMLTESSFNTFTPVSVTGAQTWSFSSSYGAVCSGYSGGQNYANEDWLVSAPIDLSGMDNVQLTFSHTRGNAAVMNVGVTEGWYKVYATANYTGDTATTTWTELTGLNQNVATAWQYISSGSLTIPDAAKSANTRIAFKYICSDTQSATWEIKNIKVTGDVQVNPETNTLFTITNWNAEWLGCPDYGPDDEALQLQNVANAMLLMDSDIYCLQEIINTPTITTVASLVALMGSSEWDGTIVPADTGYCNQRQAIIYKKSKVQLVSSLQLSSGNYAQGGSYYYNWSSGRYPAVYNVNLVSGSNLVPVTLVNIHAKAEDNYNSYTRRMGASEALKTILDGTSYNTKNVILIGDYNDYLIGTQSTNQCSCDVSSFQNFMDDTTNYTALTQNITSATSGWDPHPVIENIIISNELVGNYVANSVAQEVTVPQNITSYYSTTSDHLPISASFTFPTLATPQFSTNPFTLYPNPVKDVLYVNTDASLNNYAVAVYDYTGRQVLSGSISNNSINVSSLPTGIYIMKIANTTAKFVKE
ncbi:T9SS type A sorting domain-containing protein [Flavobacterium sp. RHBU_3]|uniref:T9SS type A sorting domain-containing protein n=1 Tax=Flavobacterium sp. RHBU_3 TaxID=3391184 RepID=UPI003984F154